MTTAHAPTRRSAGAPDESRPPRAGPPQGQRGDRRGRHPGRLRRLLRLSDHAPGRAPRVDGATDARGGPRVRPGRVGDRRDLHGARRGRDRRPGDGLDLEPRVQPDGRGDELHRGLRAARRAGQRHARRAGSRQHRAGPGRITSRRSRATATATTASRSSRRRRSPRRSSWWPTRSRSRSATARRSSSSPTGSWARRWNRSDRSTGTRRAGSRAGR